MKHFILTLALAAALGASGAPLKPSPAPATPSVGFSAAGGLPGMAARQSSALPLTKSAAAPAPTVIPPMKAVPHTSLRGILIADTSWDRTNPQVCDYRFSAYGPTREPVLVNSALGSTYGTCYFDGKYFVASHYDLLGVPFTSAAVYDAATGEMIVDYGNVEISICSTAMVYNAAEKVIYGCFLTDGPGFNIAKFDPMTGQFRKLSEISFYIYGMAFTPDGTLVGIRPSNGMLYTIDTTSGMLTPVGPTGLKPPYATSGAIDPKDGRYYFANCTDTESALYTVDLTTAKATKLYDFANNEEITGMWVPMPPHADSAPAVAASMTVTPTDGLDVEIAVKAPSTTFDDSPGEGDLFITLTEGEGNVLLDKVAVEWGAETKHTFTAGSKGAYTFTAVYSNEAGSGPSTKVERYIGGVRPGAVESATLTDLGNGIYRIDWPAVTTFADEGDYDPAGISYTVTRNADDAVVATGLTANTYTDSYPPSAGLKKLSYTVEAVYENTSGASATTDVIGTGYIVPPYSESFASSRKALVALWTVVDEDGNGNTGGWTHDSSGGRIRTKGGNDDIIATPPVYLESDKVYTLQYGVSSYSSSKTAIVGAGISSSLTPGSFRTLIEPKSVTTASKTTYETQSTTFSVDAAGFYHIGIIDSGGTGTYNYVDNFKILAPVATAAPAAATDLTVVPDTDGALSVAGSFTLPDKTIAGAALENLTKVTVARDKEVIATFTDGIAPGSPMTFADTPAQAGRYTYTVTAFNSSGAGSRAEAKVYVGINRPGPVTGIAIAETAVPGEVRIAWSSPVTDIDGNRINTAAFTYNIYDGSMEKVMEGLTDCEVTLKVCDAGQRDFALYYVQACTAAGDGESTVSTGVLPVGVAYQLPFRESFAGANCSTSWALERLTPLGDATWVMTPGSEEIPAVDGDGGFAMFLTSYAAQKSRLFSSKIRVDSERSMLSLWYYSLPQSENTLEIQIGTPVGFTTVRTISGGEAGVQGWTKVNVPLGDYKGRDISIGLLGTSVNNSQIHVDNIVIENRLDYNLAVGRLVVPEVFITDSDNTVAVKVDNHGLNDASGYKVNLLVDGDIVDTADGEPLASDGSATYNLVYRPAMTSPALVKIGASVEFAADEDLSDNDTAETAVKVKIPQYPVPGAPEGDVSEPLTIALTWKAPNDPSDTPWLEDAESLTPYAIGLPHSAVADEDLGGWTMIDADGAPTYGIEITPGAGAAYPNVGSPMAFMVFTPVGTGLEGVEIWNGCGGSSRYFMSFCAIGAANDDWMVSPELSGKAQTVSFMARSAAEQYNESFEVFASSTGTATADFVKVGEASGIPAAWTSYSYDLPEGTRYFAIRNRADDQFVLMIDDLRYNIGNPFGDIALIGYNLYRDGVKLNSTPLTACAYTDTDVVGSTGYYYRVSAVYNIGESAMSGETKLVAASPAGVAPTVAGGSSTTVYYSLQGHRIQEPVRGTIVIKVSGGKAVKELVR